MLLFFRTFLLTVFLSISIFGKAQEPKPDSRIYGPDQLLYNGVIHDYNPPTGNEGSPYLLEGGFINGSLTLKGITYTDLVMNYDICNQQVIIQYINKLGATSWFSASPAWLEAFSLGERNFIFTSINDSTRKIFQVIGGGKLKILCSWYKELKLDTQIGGRDFLYSSAKRNLFLYDEKTLKPFHSRRSFLALAEPSRQDLIRKYMRQQHIRFRRVNDKALNGLIDICN